MDSNDGCVGGFFGVIILAGLALALTCSVKDTAENRTRCEERGGVYVHGGVEADNRTTHCIQPPTPIDLSPRATGES